MRLVLYNGPAPLKNPKVLGYVAGLVLGGVPTYFSVTGPAGFHPLKALVNPKLERAAQERDGAEMMRLAVQIYHALASGPFDPVSFTKAG